MVTSSVLGVLSLRVSSKGTINNALNQPATSEFFDRMIRMPARLIVAAVLIGSLPQRIEMMS